MLWSTYEQIIILITYSTFSQGLTIGKEQEHQGSDSMDGRRGSKIPFPFSVGGERASGVFQNLLGRIVMKRATLFIKLLLLHTGGKVTRVKPGISLGLSDQKASADCHPITKFPVCQYSTPVRQCYVLSIRPSYPEASTSILLRFDSFFF